MQTTIDFSYLEEMAEGKPEFMKQVLSIFMDNTPSGLLLLEKLVNDGDDMEKIQKQAHFLKSSFGIVKVGGMHERLQQMESLAREKKDREQIEALMNEITAIFKIAHDMITEKMEQL